MVSFKFLAVILLSHWIADFICQTNEMAQNKSSSNHWLSKHITMYSFVMVLTAGMHIALSQRDSNPLAILGWVCMNGVLHFCIDFVTSRVNKYLWDQGQVHNFFVSVGLDQALHLLCLFGTSIWTFGSI